MIPFLWKPWTDFKLRDFLLHFFLLHTSNVMTPYFVLQRRRKVSKIGGGGVQGSEYLGPRGGGGANFSLAVN